MSPEKVQAFTVTECVVYIW